MVSEYEKHITVLQEMWEDNAGSLTPMMVADYMQEQGMLAIPIEPPVSPMLADKKEHRCRECNRTINEGEASVFGVCDNCWDFAMQTERRFKKQ